MLRRPSSFRQILAAAGVAVILPLAACSTSAGQPTTGGDGYVGGTPSLTQVPPASRQPAPIASGAALGSAAMLSTESYRGKVVVLNVWGSWCAPCRKEAPELQRASVATADRARFLGINCGDNDPAPAQAFVRANNLTYPNIYDPDSKVLLRFAGKLSLITFPSTLILDREGRIAARISGTVTETTLVGLIDDIAAGR